ENVGAGTEADCPPVVAAGSSSPASSYYGNYFLFESSYPLLDLDFQSSFENSLARPLQSPLAKWELAARASNEDPSLHQVYLRYNGPKDGNARFPRSSWPKAAS
ncbi:MAG: hypothetical protein QOK31_1497, partial [Solirubrobacteraceae bacterium]|nr:hypothetical protein [Solirubrobacteraceae bacterium]